MKKKIVSLLFILFSVGTSWSQLNTDRVMAIAQNALYFEDYVLAIQYFNQIISVKPYLPDPYLYRGIAKIQLGDFAGAEADCSSALALNPFIPGAYYARGFSRIKLKELEGAESDLNKYLEYNPVNDDLLRLRIWVYDLQKKYDLALKDIDQLTKKNKDSDLLMDKGQILMEKNDTIGAMTYFTDAIKADSTKCNGWSALATLKMMQHDNSGALHDFDKAIALKSKYAGDYINRGLLNYWNKNYRGAFADYDKAIELDDKSIIAHLNRGMLRSEVGDLNNAVSDFNKVIAAEPENYEALYQRALLNTEIGDYRQATLDFNKIIARYPGFSPAFWGRAKVKQLQHDAKGAYLDQMTAQEIEKKKPRNTVKKEEEPNTQAQMAKSTKSNETKASIFNDVLARGGNPSDEAPKKGGLRGAIQNVNIEISNEPNFVLSYYSKENELKRLGYYFSVIDDYNKQHKLNAKLKITNDEISLTQEMIQMHFQAIDNMTTEINRKPNADAYFVRGINYALVKDYTNAVQDFSKVIELRPDFTMAYFCRANILYKLLDFKLNNPENKEVKSEFKDEKLYKHDFETIAKDYKKVIELAPEFAFARFNLGNLYCQEKDFESAIDIYTEALRSQPDFAEAFFNRGLAYLFLNDAKKANIDLSKAGELGIYQAYNIIKRLNDN
ncbi:tetratricopeptide repeat protein [Paludibacter jiangxiensis]|uniref:Tfp pilus assembly protein PilF n=1 Tax=Paludibacter jiangxiensis TaxID=681398 RepID=A0A170ZVD9_9BACT|nr:tetratricopeptide repeat protein [Paludibacter jiangxiensis]GAT63043.1 Tfp pilus assembly protein PilF [Paludibacter jiangxiensis]